MRTELVKKFVHVGQIGSEESPWPYGNDVAVYFADDVDQVLATVTAERNAALKELNERKGTP